MIGLLVKSWKKDSRYSLACEQAISRSFGEPVGRLDTPKEYLLTLLKEFLVVAVKHILEILTCLHAFVRYSTVKWRLCKETTLQCFKITNFPDIGK